MSFSSSSVSRRAAAFEEKEKSGKKIVKAPLAFVFSAPRSRSHLVPFLGSFSISGGSLLSKLIQKRRDRAKEDAKAPKRRGLREGFATASSRSSANPIGQIHLTLSLAKNRKSSLPSLLAASALGILRPRPEAHLRTEATSCEGRTEMRAVEEAMRATERGETAAAEAAAEATEERRRHELTTINDDGDDDKGLAAAAALPLARPPRIMYSERSEGV